MEDAPAELISEVRNDIPTERSDMKTEGLVDKWKKVGEKSLIVGSVIMSG